MYTVKLHVPSSAILKCEYTKNREIGTVNAKAINFCETGHCQVD